MSTGRISVKKSLVRNFARKVREFYSDETASRRRASGPKNPSKANPFFHPILSLAIGVVQPIP